jgi:hemicentin
VVSLRDIQRVFDLVSFFKDLEGIVKGHKDGNETRRAILLTTAAVYLLRLSPMYRERFIQKIEALPSERSQPLQITPVLDEAMNRILDETDLPKGIARTIGLKENCFMTLICALSRTPLIVIGPPGSSKTLSVNMITGNAKGEESRKTFYRSFPRFVCFLLVPMFC